VGSVDMLVRIKQFLKTKTCLSMMLNVTIAETKEFVYAEPQCIAVAIGNVHNSMIEADVPAESP